MSAEQVISQLNTFEELSRSRAAVHVERMQPGLTPAELRSVELRHGLQLHEDIKAVWSWHNGGDPENLSWFWGPGRLFLDLERSIADGKMRLDARNYGDVFRYPDSTWITLGKTSVASVIDIPQPNAEPRVFVSEASSSPEDYPIVTIAEQIGWCNWAIENDVWELDNRRQWIYSKTNRPTFRERHLL